MLIFFAVMITLHLRAQDHSWWNEKHDWDGVTHWKDYLIFSSGFMGPNALPVPDINRGEFSDKYEFEIGLQQHSGKGDKTINFLSDLIIPISPGKAGIKIHYIPVEFYETDTLTRDLRKAHEYDTKGYSYGDVYFTTYIQAIKDHPKLPDLLFTINLKTTSGTNMGSARHTDAPGYYFDASLAKTFQTGSKYLESWRPYFMGGFYSYQTNRHDYEQNDAFLFGFGLLTSTALLQIDNQLGGYIGYIRNGDQPVVYRLTFLSNYESAINYKVGFQFGIHDVPFNSLTVSGVLRFEDLKMFRKESE